MLHIKDLEAKSNKREKECQKNALSISNYLHALKLKYPNYFVVKIELSYVEIEKRIEVADNDFYFLMK